MIECAANCRQCYGEAANQCTKCEDGYYLDQETCLLYDGTLDTECDNTDPGEDNYYQLDLRDMRCKRTINDIDNPCEPATYNKNAGASLPSACQTCSPGKLHLKQLPQRSSEALIFHGDFSLRFAAPCEP